MSAAATKPRGARPLEPGRTVAERYVVQRVLGQGGMGQVVEVEHAALGRRFALKVLRLERWNDELVRRFNREARALARLTTPRVAQVTDFGVDDECGPFYVMELLEGETLEDRLEREERLEPREALTIGAELCEALAEVHAAGIVHRDLKPSNVGLPSRGPVGVKLLDFGLAAAMDDAFLSRITQSQQVLGSLPYMAPEQFDGSEPSPSIDIYAVGVVVYEAVVGRLPFMAPSTAALIHQILATPPPALPGELSGLGALPGLLERLLAKEPSARFASAGAAAQALRQVAARLDAASASAVRLPPTVEARSGVGPLPATAEARAVTGAPDAESVGSMPTLAADSGSLSGSLSGAPSGAPPSGAAVPSAESGTRLSSHAPAAPPGSPSTPPASHPHAASHPSALAAPPRASASAFSPHAAAPASPPSGSGPSAYPSAPAAWGPTGPVSARPAGRSWAVRLALAVGVGLAFAGLTAVAVAVGLSAVSGPRRSETPPAPPGTPAEPTREDPAAAPSGGEAAASGPSLQPGQSERSAHPGRSEESGRSEGPEEVGDAEAARGDDARAAGGADDARAAGGADDARATSGADDGTPTRASDRGAAGRAADRTREPRFSGRPASPRRREPPPAPQTFEARPVAPSRSPSTPTTNQPAETPEWDGRSTIDEW